MFTANECVLRSHANNWIFISLKAVNYIPCQCTSVGSDSAWPCQDIFHCNIVGNENVLPRGWLGWALCPPAIMVWSDPVNITQLLLELVLIFFSVMRCHPQLSPRWSADFNCSWTALWWILSIQYSDQLCYTASLHPNNIYMQREAIHHIYSYVPDYT